MDKKNNVFFQLYTTRVGNVLIFGLPFAVISFFSIARGELVLNSVVTSLVSGLFFGLVMMLISGKRIRQQVKYTQQITVKKNRLFLRYFRKNRLPESESERKEYREYLVHYLGEYQSRDRSFYVRRVINVISVLFIIFLFIVTFLIKQLRLLSLIYPAVLLIGLWSEYKKRNTLSKMKRIVEELG